ncbi:MAG: ABC transporter permease [Blastocatellia bacterium]|nr:ABC transporter permease [Blastocatellia bacterium]
MASLAMRNLFYDRVRLGVTLVGIVFSVVLSSVQLGLFFGFMHATSDLIDNSAADLWVLSAGVTHIETGVPFLEQKGYQVASVAGVEQVEKHFTGFGQWKRPNGAEEGILLVGFDLDNPLGGPWNVVQGSVEGLNEPDAVMVDELYREKLGVTHLGQVLEIRGRRARVVGFTRGIRTFTTSPAVFTSFKNAQDYAGMKEDQTMYLLVKAAPGANLQALKREIGARVADVDVYTKGEFSRKQAFYWMFGTGAGITVLIAAGLGLLVGVVVVAQTIYASTMDHIREYGTLKAMGASNGYIYRVIIKQAAMSGVIGYAIGMSVSLLVSRASLQGTTAIILPGPLVAGLFVLTLLMCIGASMVSINKVTRLDPAMVFKG